MGKTIKKWPKEDEVDEETEYLVQLVDSGWDWNWPGWNWVANMVNRNFRNNRSASSCRHKYDSLQEKDSGEEAHRE